jgi:hypothetical protein
MKEVFVVVERCEYEGYYIMGVFSTAELASEEANRHNRIYQPETRYAWRVLGFDLDRLSTSPSKPPTT